MHAALDQLIELLGRDPDFVEYDPSWSSAAKQGEHAVLQAYFAACADWYSAGLELDVDARHRIRALWRDQPRLRARLRLLVELYPCDEFEGLAHDFVAAGQFVYFPAWFHWAPRLEGMWRTVVVANSKKFNQTWTAINAGLLWARWLGGGDDAYLAIAHAFNRHARGHLKKPEMRDSEDFVRHCLEVHGEIDEGEARQVNRHLLKLDCALIEAGDRWVPDESEVVTNARKMPAFRRADAYDVERLRARARAFAGAAWSAVDDAGYRAAAVRARTSRR